MLTLDHLEGVKKRAHLHFASEPGLTDAFQGLTGEEDTSVEDMANMLAHSLQRVPLYEVYVKGRSF